MRWLICLLPLVAQAAIAPEHYAQSQAAAPEALKVKVVEVDKEACLFCKDAEVVAQLEVLSVERSASGLKPGAKITLKYIWRKPDPSIDGPRGTPLLEAGATTEAWLRKDAAGHYVPAARGYSFQRVRLRPASVETIPDTKPAGSD